MNRVRIALSGLLLLAVPAWAQEAPQPAREPASFARWLPADTVAFLEVAPMTAEEQQRAVAYKAMGEPELRRVLDRMIGDRGEFSNVVVPVGSSIVRAALDIRESGIAFDVRHDQGDRSRMLRVRGHLGVSFHGLARRSRGGLALDLAISLGVVNDPGESYELLRGLLIALAEEQDGPSRTKPDRFLRAWEHRERRCTSVLVQGTAFHLTSIDRRLIVTTRRARLVDILDRAFGDDAKSPSLAESPLYTGALRDARGEGTVTSFALINVKAGLENFAATGVPRLALLPRMTEQLGLGGLEGITSISRVDGDGVAGATSVILTGQRVGLGRLFEAAPPAKFGALGFAPRETLYVAAGRLDVAGIVRALNESAPTPLQFLGVLLQEQAEINLFDDVLARIGSESSLIVSMNRGFIPDIGCAIGSDDPLKLRDVLHQFLASFAWPKGAGIQATKIGDVDAFVLRTGFPDHSSLPVAPTFGAVDGHVLVALHPIGFQRFVATKRGERESILENGEFVALRKRVPESALSLSYLDLRRGLAIAYDTALPLLQSMPTQEGSIPIFEFPDAESFTRHLYGRIAWREADERGMHWRSHSSTDVGSVVVGLSAAGATLALFTVGMLDEPPRKAEGEERPVPVAKGKQAEVDLCRSNLRRIRDRLRQLQRRNTPWPADLEGLRGRWIEEETLQVPGTDGKRYSYFGPKGKNGLLVVGAPNGPDGHVCVLMVDLKMTRLSPEQVKAALRD